jgi:hypothetical protein
VLANYDTIASRVPPQFRGRLPGTAGGCDPSRLAKS